MASLLSTVTLLLLCLAAAAVGGRTGKTAWDGQPQPAQGGTVEADQQGMSPLAPECFTPRSQEGHCIRLHACKPLLDLLRTARLGPRGLPATNVTLLLRRSHCGFQGNAVMVCCPDSAVDENSYRGKPDRPDMTLTAAPPAETLSFTMQPGPSWPTGTEAGSAPANQEAPYYHPPAAAAAAAAPSGTDFVDIPDRQFVAGKTPAKPQQHDYPAENLALLPTEVCGLHFAQLLQQRSTANTNRTMLMQYPWMARLGYRVGGDDRVEYLCSGSLISERYVLTAAHCIGVHNGPVSVRLGEVDAATDPDCVDAVCAPNVVDVAIEERIVHPDQDRGLNDIALVRLARPIVFSEAVSPVCLPVPVHDRPEEDSTGKMMVVAGWGNTSPNKRQNAPSRWLLHHKLQVAEPSTCHAAYDSLDDVKFDADKHLCVSGGCNGDSGSPLMLTEDASQAGSRVILFGVLSYGVPDCALRGAPMAYSRVALYVPWVLRSLKPNPFVPKDRNSGSGLVDPRGAGAVGHY